MQQVGLNLGEGQAPDLNQASQAGSLQNLLSCVKDGTWAANSQDSLGTEKLSIHVI